MITERLNQEEEQEQEEEAYLDQSLQSEKYVEHGRESSLLAALDASDSEQSEPQSAAARTSLVCVLCTNSPGCGALLGHCAQGCAVLLDHCAQGGRAFLDHGAKGRLVLLCPSAGSTALSVDV